MILVDTHIVGKQRQVIVNKITLHRNNGVGCTIELYIVPAVVGWKYNFENLTPFQSLFLFPGKIFQIALVLNWQEHRMNLFTLFDQADASEILVNDTIPINLIYRKQRCTHAPQQLIHDRLRKIIYHFLSKPELPQLLVRNFIFFNSLYIHIVQYLKFLAKIQNS